MKKILPSILSADFTNLATDIATVEKGGADMLHVDIMDGHFVPNITIGPAMVKQIGKASNLPMDVHLMISDPEKYIPQFADAGSEYISFHIEVAGDISKIIKQIKDAGVKAGLSVKPKTPINSLEPFIEDLDMVLVMSVEPGFGGQSFMKDSIPRIKELVKLISTKKNTPVIEVDGGVNLENIKELSDAGVDFFVAGNTVFKEKDRKKIITDLKSLING